MISSRLEQGRVPEVEVLNVHVRTIGLMSVLWILAPHPLSAQTELEAARRIECRFSLMAVGTWGPDGPGAEVKPAALALEFESINADEGTAQLASGFGVYDIIVRYAEGYLHFIQSFLDGPLHVTTILEKETSAGTLKAMHSRHEHTDFALTGFTSSPEQYYGECEIID